MPKALITGVTGQDGSYLAEFLLDKGYEVVGMVRRTSHDSYERIEHLLDRIEIVAADLLDQHSLTVVLQEPARTRSIIWRPSRSSPPPGPSRCSPGNSPRWASPESSRRPAGAPRRPVLSGQLVRDVRQGRETPQRETTSFYPRSPYGVAKVYGHWITVNYRESYDLFAVSGILFNHESPRRGIEFVTRKVTDGVARIKLGLASELRLGNLDARRDGASPGTTSRPCG